MTWLAAEDLADLRRWAISGAVVATAYGGIAAAMVTWHEPIASSGEPGSAIVIEFAPLLASPGREQSELPPGPEMEMSDASPSKESPEDGEKEETKTKVEVKFEQKVEEKVEIRPVEQTPEVPPAPNPEVAVLPPPPREVEQEAAKRQELRPPSPVTSAPKPSNSSALVTWQKQMSAVIEHHLRFPTAADRGGAKGDVKVAFGLDRQGRLIDSRIARSSGNAQFDEEALAVLRRVQSFPAPPADLSGDRVDVTLPVRFVRSQASSVAKR
jgi:protein TonB